MIALKLPFHFNVPTILDEINQIPENEFVELSSIYIGKGSLFALHLIQPMAFGDDSSQKVIFEPTARLQQLDYLKIIENTFPSRKETYRIHKLMPYGEIRKHRDVGINFDKGLFRIHIPVKVNEDSVFHLFGEELDMKPGECWYVDVDLPHFVRNNGKTERIHLVMDCVKNEWWSRIFEELGYKNNHADKYSRMTITELINMKDSVEEMAREGMESVLAEVNKEIEKRKRSG